MRIWACAPLIGLLLAAVTVAETLDDGDELKNLVLCGLSEVDAIDLLDKLEAWEAEQYNSLHLMLLGIGGNCAANFVAQNVQKCFVKCTLTGDVKEDQHLFQDTLSNVGERGLVLVDVQDAHPAFFEVVLQFQATQCIIPGTNKPCPKNLLVVWLANGAEVLPEDTPEDALKGMLPGHTQYQLSALSARFIIILIKGAEAMDTSLDNVCKPLKEQVGALLFGALLFGALLYTLYGQCRSTRTSEAPLEPVRESSVAPDNGREGTPVPIRQSSRLKDKLR